MGFLKRFFNIGAGLGAGLLAYRLISRYEKKQMIEAEYRVLLDSEAEAAESEKDPKQEETL